MNKHTLKYTISICTVLFVFILRGQNVQQDSIRIQNIDSLSLKENYGLRVGIDISRPIIQLAQKEPLGFEVMADYRVTKDLYIATELGSASEPTTEDYIAFHSKGQYGKIGFNYNAYENFPGMHNEIYAGLRYGFSRFQQELISFDIHDYYDYFGDSYQTPHKKYTNLSAHWLGLHIGLKVEIVKNLFLNTSVQVKKIFSEKKPENFENLYIPGFGQRLLHNNAVGFNYGISYLIPLKKR